VLAVPFCICIQIEHIVALRASKIFGMAPCVPMHVDMARKGRLEAAGCGVQRSFSFEVFMCWPSPFEYVFK
jgi:hypothetical protein